MKRYNITVNGTAYDVTVEETDGSAAPVAAPAAAPPPPRSAPPRSPCAPDVFPPYRLLSPGPW